MGYLHPDLEFNFGRIPIASGDYTDNLWRYGPILRM